MKTAKAFSQIRDIATGKVEGKGRGGVCSVVGVTRGLEPAISRLWGKGVSTRLVRIDPSINNLGMVLSDATHATILRLKVPETYGTH